MSGSLTGTTRCFPCVIVILPSGSTKNRLRRLEQHLVDVTPDPILSRLEGLDNRVVGRVEMFGSVLILRLVATADMPTDETEAQVYPGASNFQTVLTSIGARRDVLYLIEMRTTLCHVLFLPDAFILPAIYLYVFDYLGTLLHDE